MLSVVVDTNVLVSGFFWRGIPGQILDSAIAGEFNVVISEILLYELSNVLARPKFTPDLQKIDRRAEEITNLVRTLAIIAIPVSLPEELVRDPKDVALFECAVGGNADHIISGDQDLLTIEQYGGITIVTPRQFLEMLRK